MAAVAAASVPYEDRLFLDSMAMLSVGSTRVNRVPVIEASAD